MPRDKQSVELILEISVYSTRNSSKIGHIIVTRAISCVPEVDNDFIVRTCFESADIHIYNTSRFNKRKHAWGFIKLYLNAYKNGEPMHKKGNITMRTGSHPDNERLSFSFKDGVGKHTAVNWCEPIEHPAGQTNDETLRKIRKTLKTFSKITYTETPTK